MSFFRIRDRASSDPITAKLVRLSLDRFTAISPFRREALEAFLLSNSMIIEFLPQDSDTHGSEPTELDAEELKYGPPGSLVLPSEELSGHAVRRPIISLPFEPDTEIPHFSATT